MSVQTTLLGYKNVLHVHLPLSSSPGMTISQIRIGSASGSDPPPDQLSTTWLRFQSFPMLCCFCVVLHLRPFSMNQFMRTTNWFKGTFHVVYFWKAKRSSMHSRTTHPNTFHRPPRLLPRCHRLRGIKGLGPGILRLYCGKLWINFDKWRSFKDLFSADTCSPTLVYCDAISDHAHKQLSCTKPRPGGMSLQ